MLCSASTRRMTALSPFFTCARFILLSMPYVIKICLSRPMMQSHISSVCPCTRRNRMYTFRPYSYPFPCGYWRKTGFRQSLPLRPDTSPSATSRRRLKFFQTAVFVIIRAHSVRFACRTVIIHRHMVACMVVFFCEQRYAVQAELRRFSECVVFDVVFTVFRRIQLRQSAVRVELQCVLAVPLPVGA